jgi:ABC-type glycerol-3-phosphate transport system permease component
MALGSKPIHLTQTRPYARGGMIVWHMLLRLAIYALLLIIVAAIVAPFMWTLSNAFKDQTTIYANPPTWLPSPFIIDNFVSAWTQVPFGLFLIE